MPNLELILNNAEVLSIGALGLSISSTACKFASIPRDNHPEFDQKMTSLNNSLRNTIYIASATFGVVSLSFVLRNLRKE